MFFCRSWPQKDLCSHVTGREGSGNAWRMISSAKLKSYGSELDLGISGKKSQMKSFTLRFLSALGFKTFPWRNPPLPGNLKLLTIQTGTPHWMTCSSFLKSLCKVDSTSSLCWLEGGQFFPRVNYIAHFGGVKQYLCWGISLITMHFLGW